MAEVYLDFEFNQTQSERVNLVSCATFDPATGKTKSFWLHNSDHSDLKQYLKKYNLFICYAAVAEARSFLSLGLNPLNANWIDIYLEYRMVSNHNDNLNWGKQLVSGKIKHTIKPKPKWQRTEDEKKSGFKPTYSLAEATFKLTGNIVDTTEKEEVRTLIISNPKEFTREQKQRILAYGEQDIRFLPQLLKQIKKELFAKIPAIEQKNYLKEALLRGRYAALTALMESKGYPINLEHTKNFSSSAGIIQYEVQRDINEQFPEILPFRWNSGSQRYSKNTKAWKKWISENHDLDRWEKTDTGDISLSLDAFSAFYSFKHDYPRGNFGAQIVRYLKLNQAIYGFIPSDSKESKSFFDFMGPDKRIRPYMGIYGSQSSRSQPGASGFLFLRPAWMRALCQPVKGRVCGGIDYSSEEYLISALESGSKNMIKAYASGDVYLQFAKDAKMVPATATKESHKRERDLCKATVLGISYLMTKVGLAVDLTGKTGERWTEDAAQGLIDSFYSVNPELADYQQSKIEEYEFSGFLKLPCGWYMMGDNENKRSVSNFPIQGLGSSIMRKAVDLCYSRDLEVIFTLHDAIYIEFNYGDWEKMKVLHDCMKEAFVSFFPKNKKDAELIRMDPFIWGPGLERDSEVVSSSGYKVPCSDIYIDDRAIKEYERFSKYFGERIEDNL
jgi:hypothetical protein